MRTLKEIICASVLVLALLSTAAAQDSAALQKSTLTITAAAAGERVRITAPSSVVQMHVEVYAAGGEKLFDQEIRGGNVFDWHIKDGQAQRLAAGAYVCVVTARSVSGKLIRKIGAVTVDENSASVGPGESQLLSPPQAQAIGPVEADSSWTIVTEGDNQTATVIANNGTDGQMIRGRGALTFRIGNFFSGIDTEQMRLTEEGNLGIGTSQPQAKLDVAGTVRAERFLVARPKPGSASQTQASNSAPATGATDSVQPLTSGSGTQNHIAKWTDNAGMLGDSAITETVGGNVGIGTTATVALDIYGKFKINNDGTGKWGASGAQGLLNWDTNLAIIGGYAGNNLGLFANNTQYATLTTAGKFGLGTTAPNSLFEIKGAVPVLSINGTASNSFRGLTFLDDGSDFGTKLTANASTGELRDSVGPAVGWGGFRTFYTDTTEKMRITSSGNVGIGTTTPASRLEVAGNVKVTGNGNGFFFADGTSMTTAGATLGANTFTGNQTVTGNVSATGTLSTTGAVSGASASFTGDVDTTTSYKIGGARVLSVAGTNNTFAGVGAGASNTTGLSNSFFGYNAGEGNSAGNSNAYFGAGAGTNTGGSGNAFFGASAGFSSGNENNNTFIGNSTNGAEGITNATALGSNARVTQSNSLVLGSINGVNSATSNTKVGIGTTAPAQPLEVVGNVKVSGDGNGFIFADNTTMTTAGATLGANTFTGNQTVTGNVSASGTLSATGVVSGASANFTGDVNTTTQYNIGGNRVLSVPGVQNIFAGAGAGANNSGPRNSFFGVTAGGSNANGFNNSFFGWSAGLNNTSGNNNAFFGASAGKNATADNNAFFGVSAGFANTAGGSNAFFGFGAGQNNSIGSSNIFIGTNSGITNTVESNNTFIGTSANGAAGITNATAIGSNASVTQSNSLVLGSINTVNGATSNTNVGIGTTAPSSVFHIVSQAEQLITASTSWTGGAWFNLANTDTGARTWSLISSASTNGEGAGKLLVRDTTVGAVRMTFNTTGNVGIGTTGPNAKLHVAGGDVAITTQSNGVILRATDGANCYRVTVNNAGTLSTALVTCP